MPRTDRSRSGITNVNIGMNISNKTENQPKVQDKTEDPIYDSGILSDTNLTSEQHFSENIDLPKSASEKTDDINHKSKNELMSNLDSGIDIELSDQQCSSSNLEISSADLYPSVSDSSERDEQKLAKRTDLQDVYPWELYFIQSDNDGNTFFHIAIMEGYPNAISLLLEHIPNSRYLDIRNDYCQTPLHLSVLMNQASIVRKLVLSGASTYIVDRYGNTALHLACKVNSLECIKALLDPINSYEYEHIVLRYIPKIDFPCAYIDEYNYSGITCIHVASEVDKTFSILNELFLHGADINIRECKGGYTILHEAVSSRNEELIRYILQHPRINLEVKTYSKLTAYQLSSECSPIGKMLLERKAVKLPFPKDDEESDEESESDDENSAFNISSVAGSFNQHENLHVVVTS